MRRWHSDPSAAIDDAARERRLHHYCTFLMARDAEDGESGSARIQLAEEAIHDEARRIDGQPIERQLEAMETLLGELGLLEAAQCHADFLATRVEARP